MRFVLRGGVLLPIAILHVFSPDLLQGILDDTSDFPFGAILEQKYNCRWNMMVFFSKYLMPTEASYSVTA